MRKIVMAVMAAASVIFASCDQGRDIAVSEFTVDMANDGNTVRVSVVPSDESVSYCTGLIMEDDYAALGEDGLVSYINDQVASAELKTGPSTEVYQERTRCGERQDLQALCRVRSGRNDNSSLCGFRQWALGSRQLSGRDDGFVYLRCAS